MMPHDSHPSDQELLRSLDGELPRVDARRVAAHLSSCWSCRARKQELESSIFDCVRAYRDNFDPLLPAPDASRAMLKARLAQYASAPKPFWTSSFWTGWTSAWDWK